MSPRTRVISWSAALCAVALLGACGEPPQPRPTSPTYATASAGAISIGPSLPGTGVAPPPATGVQPLPAPTGAAYPAYPTYPTPTRPPTQRTTTTPPPTTKSPTPTPSHAPRCTGEPTGAQILALIKGKPGVPDKPLRLQQGPFCSGTWSFTTVEVSGTDEDDLEPLMVVATGAAATLTLVAAGTDVCIEQVQTGAPAGIRVLACGF